MPPFPFLRKDHRRLKTLLAKLQKSRERAPELRAGLLETLRHELQAHGQVEEKLLYPALRAIPVENASLRADQAFHDHRDIDATLLRLQETPPDDPRFAAGVDELARRVDRHVRSEEDEFLPVMEGRLSPELLRRLDRQMRELKGVLGQPTAR